MEYFPGRFLMDNSRLHGMQGQEPKQKKAPQAGLSLIILDHYYFSETGAQERT
jgi:hypothetical protein